MDQVDQSPTNLLESVQAGTKVDQLTKASTQKALQGTEENQDNGLVSVLLFLGETMVMGLWPWL
jgi:hypothetical protein